MFLHGFIVCAEKFLEGGVTVVATGITVLRSNDITVFKGMELYGDIMTIDIHGNTVKIYSRLYRVEGLAHMNGCNLSCLSDIYSGKLYTVLVDELVNSIDEGSVIIG